MRIPGFILSSTQFPHQPFVTVEIRAVGQAKPHQRQVSASRSTPFLGLQRLNKSFRLSNDSLDMG